MIPTLNEVIASLAKDSDMGSKAILETATGVPEKAIVRYIRRCIIKPLIYPRRGRIYRVSSRAGKNPAEAAKDVGGQVNARPEVIQREPHDEVSCYYTCRRVA